MNHYDTHHSAYARNVSRMLHGHLLTVGPEDREQVVCIDRVKNVIVGIDRDGIFVGVEVYDTAGGTWTLYGDGLIEDADHQNAGRHDIKTETLRTVEQPQEVQA